MYKKIFDFSIALNYVLDAIFTAICPPAILIFLTLWIRKTYEIGDWIVIVGASLGLVIGLFSLFRFIIKISKYIANKESKEEQKDGKQK